MRKTIFVFYLIFFLSALLPTPFIKAGIKNVDILIHLFYFFLLSLLTFPLINLYFSLLILFLFSFLTEISQIIVPLRNFSEFDVIADITGILLAFIAYKFFLKKEKKVFLAFSSIFGIGFIKGGGTIASIFAIVIYQIFKPSLITVSIIIILTFFYTLHFGKYLRIEKDPSFFVIDEFSGMFFIMPLMENHILTLVGFLLYRIFDILKPFGIRRLENIKIFGVLLDDWAGAILTGIIIILIKFLYPRGLLLIHPLIFWQHIF